MGRTIARLIASVALTGVMVLLLALPALAAGEEIGTAIDRVTAWIRGILIALGILVFIIGAAFFMIEGTTGGQERGKGLMVAAVVAVILGFLAGPIVNLAASFVR
jgi:type IV secretion system pilin